MAGSLPHNTYIKGVIGITVISDVEKANRSLYFGPPCDGLCTASINFSRHGCRTEVNVNVL